MLVLSFLKGILVGFMIVSPILFGLMYITTVLNDKNTTLYEHISIKKYYLNKSEDLNLFGHIIWLIMFFMLL